MHEKKGTQIISFIYLFQAATGKPKHPSSVHHFVEGEPEYHQALNRGRDCERGRIGKGMGE